MFSGAVMKKLATCLIGVVGLIGTPAFAANMAVKAPRPLPAPAPAFSWTGCYLGGYAGGAWHESDGASFTDLGQNGLGAAGSIVKPPFMSYSGGAVAARIVPQHSWSADLDSTFIGGGTLGCNWQPIGSPFVLGLEGEAGYMRLKGQAFDPNTIVNDPGGDATKAQNTPDVLGSAKVGDWYGMVTGRLGYAWDRTLIYVKGGAAFVPTRASVTDVCTTAGQCGNWTISTAGSHTATTWTLGGGIEWAFAPSWSVKAEYMFITLGDHHGFQTCGTAQKANNGGPVGGGDFCFNHGFDAIG